MEYGPSSLGIVFSGKLEKRRDGAVRGGWTSRTFVLTRDSIHYYRKLQESDLLGEERDNILLSDIVSVKSLSEDEVPSSATEAETAHHFLEIVNNKGRDFLMRVPGSDSTICDAWANTIQDLIRGVDIQYSLNPSKEGLLEPQLLEIADILTISIVGGSKASPSSSSSFPSSNIYGENEEWIFKRNAAWGENVDLGVLPQGAACVITLGGGGCCRVGTQALMSTWDSGLPCWVTVTDSEYSMEIKLSAQCDIIRQKKESSQNPTKSLLPKSLSILEELVAIGYFVFCILLHIFHGVEAVHWSNKCTITIGAALAITALVNSSSRKKPEIFHVKKQKTPEIRFSICLHQLKVCSNGKEYLMPQLDMRDSANVQSSLREGRNITAVVDDLQVTRQWSSRASLTVKKVNSSWLYNWLQNEERGILIDSRPTFLYNEGHIAQAINLIPSISLEEAASSIHIPTQKMLFLGREKREVVIYYDRNPVGEEWASNLSEYLIKENSVDCVKLLGDPYPTFANRYGFMIRMGDAEDHQDPTKPTTKYPNEIIEGFLYAGNSAQAVNEEIINSLQITHVINCDKMCSNRHDPLLDSEKNLNNFAEESVILNRQTTLDFGAFYDFIDNAKRHAGSRVCVQCCSSLSESTSLLIWYSMKTQHSSLVTAFNYVMQRRPTIKPKVEGIHQLLQEEFKLYHRNSLAKEEIQDLLDCKLPDRTLQAL